MTAEATRLDAVDCTLRGAEDTAALGRLLAPLLPPSAIVCLEGPLGSGKTTLVKALCGALGIVEATVTSPTYTLVNVYPGGTGSPSVYHADLFRLQSPDELLELDRDDWVNPDGPTLIEWPQVALPLLEGEALLWLHLAHDAATPAARRCRVEAADADYAPLLRAAAAFVG